MTREEKFAACVRFFEALSEALKDRYEQLGSCNHDNSVYLIPIGTEDQVSYYGKPKFSFRISDHWNWFASIERNADPHYVQCLSADMPWPRPRTVPGQPTKPIWRTQVAFFGKDRKYHCVFGERFDRKTRTWEWYEGDLADAIKMAVKNG